MKKIGMRCVCLCLMVMLAFGLCTGVTFGATKKLKQTSYYGCVVSGDYAYCLTDNILWKVNVNDGSMKTLAKFRNGSYLCNLRVKGGYLYFVYQNGDSHSCIYRIKKSGTAKKRLCKIYDENEDLCFAFKGKKIFYTWTTGTDYEPMKTHKKKMKLNGSKKSGTKTKVVYKEKNSNKTGYKIDHQEAEYEEEWGYNYFLVTPNNTFFITEIMH